jgi:hypothetical protein
MKNKVLIFMLLNLISISLLSAKENSSSYFDSLIRIHNEKITELNNEILLLKNGQKSNDNELKQQIKELKNPDLPWSIKFIPIFVSIMAVILTFGLGTITFVGYFKSKDATDKVDKAGEKIDKFKDDFQKLYVQYEEKIEDKISELNSFEEKTKFRIEEIINPFSEEAAQIKRIERDLSSHRSYIKHSIELLFDTLIWFANNTKDKELLKSVFIKRAISNLYSFDEKERFSGIAALGQIGTLSEIIHLEHVINDKSENDNNRLLANKAIVNINMTSK